MANETIKPRSRNELRRIVAALVKENCACDLNHIDVSDLEHFDHVFQNLRFYGSISKWNTSKAITMRGMFENCTFNGNIGHWDVGNVTCFVRMFRNSDFAGNLSHWNVNTNLSILEFDEMLNPRKAHLPPLALAKYGWNKQDIIWGRGKTPHWSKMLRKEDISLYHFLVKAHRPQTLFKKEWTKECEELLAVCKQCTTDGDSAATMAFHTWLQKRRLNDTPTALELPTFNQGVTS